MYGVPTNLDLQRFVGAMLIQVALGEFQVQFRFHPEGEIAVEGHWELRDQSGYLVDQAQPTHEREGYRVHRVIGRKVVASLVDAPTSITLKFDSGHRLQIFDSSREYESFSIQPGDVFV